MDLEIDRVSKEKRAYSANVMKNLKLTDPLNVDLIIRILERNCRRHRVPNDRYAELFDELTQNGVGTAGELIALIERRRETAMALNREAAESVVKGDLAYNDEYGKAKDGIYYSHVGLVWNMLKLRELKDQA